ncbi:MULTISPECIES: M20 metallopeptidase family protein [Eubacteriales]|uniref:M20 metallopeptidase family protein n=1 Tax=Eubacteriales TaxID=186802 RepID=UPI002942E0B5|nr:M20 family metallopeptidase [Dysosmobacter welbionis]
MVEIRRDIHRHPEIGRNEVRTSALIRKKLEEYGVDAIERPVPTAVVALIHGARGPGRCVALRCDIDALPVQEETGLPYTSENPGIMHACGHDMHASMMLGAAKILCGMRERFAGCVKLIFQHSEDTLPGGAKELVEKGVLENPHVDAIYGMHVLPDAHRAGQVGFHIGPITTSVDLFDFTVSGRGGHGSQPQNTTDPVLAAAQMIVMMQQIVARRVDPMEMAVFSLGSIHGGDAPNVIPAEVKFGGVTRAYSESVRGVIKEQVQAIAKGIEAASGNTVHIHYADGYPSAFNDKELMDLAADAVRKELGEDAVVPMPDPMPFSEDFSFYGKLGGIPSAYLMLYAGHEGELAPLHNPKCAVREDVMPAGIRTLVSIALEFLK